MAKPNDAPPPDDNIVDADPDPIAERAAHLMHRAAEEAAFAREQSRFAQKTLDYSTDLDEEGQTDESEEYMREGTALMAAANQHMDRALEEDAEVKRLLEGKRHDMSRALSIMPDQNLYTLHDAVSAVREYVGSLSDLQIYDLGHAAHQSPAAVKAQCDVVVATGHHIEITLVSIEQVRRDPYSLAKQLVTFITIAMEFAKYLPKLHELMGTLWQVLASFH